jgi:sarcosine oxidase/L-pipecolate oxidase
MDAASTDMNKVVRWDYSDPDYSLLARKAIDIWNDDFKGIYFQ